MAIAVNCMITNKLIPTSIISKLSPPSPKELRVSGSAAPKITSQRICCSHSHSPQPHQRQSAHYQPTIWSYDFVQSLDINDNVEMYEEQVKKLEEELKCMLIENELDDDGAVLNKLELVDEIQRLGLGYRFKEDIRKVIDGIFNVWDDQGFHNNATAEKSLRTAALGFRLLRHHGYRVSEDIFKSFKDDNNGDFKESIRDDVKGMLSLYEASFLAFEGENLLDEAKAFTIMHLRNLIRENANTSVAEEVNHALELPLHQRMQRLEARWYIESYSERPDANQLLLQLAKLDFNMVQSTLQNELKDMSRWWKGLGLANKLSFTRDRLMECFFWALGMVSEPKFSTPRKELTKVAALITVIDDVYDVYGTLDELELFTKAVERWDVNDVNVLPDYMKLCFLALYNTVNEMVYETLKEQGQNSLPYLTKAWADMCKAFLVEAKWSQSKYKPTFDEYIENAWISVSGVLLLIHAYYFVSENISNHGVDCLENHHNLLRWPSIIFRLSNDLGTSAAEIQRGETANSISCSMRQNNHSEDFARKYLHDMMEGSWKNINMEIADGDSPFTKPFLDIAINLARISRCTYQYGDGHGAPDKRSKNRVLSLIIDPIK